MMILQRALLGEDLLALGPEVGACCCCIECVLNVYECNHHCCSIGLVCVLCRGVVSAIGRVAARERRQ
jgi:hypothetical protein